MNDWHEEAYELSLQGLNSTEIAQKLNMNSETVRQALKRMRKKRGTSRENHGSYTPALTGQVVTPPQPPKNKSKIKFDGTVYTYEDELEIIDGQEITPELIMIAKDLNPIEWEVVSFTKNIWQSQTQGGGTIDLCQSKLSVKPKKKDEITFEDIEEFFETHDFQIRIPHDYPTPTVKDGYVAEICVADVHFGMLAYEGEVGSNYDLKIARQRYLSAIDDVKKRLEKTDLSEIYFVTLGDLLHIDNDKNTTHKGTQVQADGRLSKIYRYAFDTVNESLQTLKELGVPIHFVFLVGNHDRDTSQFLAFSLMVANTDIDFDISPNPMKAIHFGKVLVGLNHGDFPRKNKGSWLINDYRKEYGESEYVEEHCGHIHNETSQMMNGVMCRSISSMCGKSYYDYQQAYRSEFEGIMSFIWDKENGLKEIWFSKGE